MLTCWFNDHKWKMIGYRALNPTIFLWKCKYCKEEIENQFTREVLASDVLGSYLPKSKLRNRYGNFIGFLKLWKEV